ncbi:hypothetical protein [Streptomyces sp. NPDC018610]|uniref:hypothetical protein n=1 Tax=Streptomyces sp. NPDC018610 TaxID=3365049 RepID=UPI00379A7FC2
MASTKARDALVAAATLSAALVEDRYRRIRAGESPLEGAATAPARARRAFGPVEKGLSGYAVKA